MPQSSPARRAFGRGASLNEFLHVVVAEVLDLRLLAEHLPAHSRRCQHLPPRLCISWRAFDMQRPRV
jgi:hypothetical protein